ncbi:hypothetical protein VPH35_053430 [Triticum aestivum]
MPLYNTRPAPRGIPISTKSIPPLPSSLPPSLLGSSPHRSSSSSLLGGQGRRGQGRGGEESYSSSGRRRSWWLPTFHTATPSPFFLSVPSTAVPSSDSPSSRR